MPELPEVETIVRDLAPLVEGTRIVRVQVWDPLLAAFPSGEDFNRRLTGGIIRTIRRRGKYLCFELGQGLLWLVHLRMTGRLVAQLTPMERHRRAQFTLDNGGALFYCDLRRFGDMWALWPGEERHAKGFIALGPEPLSEQFSVQWLRGKLANRKAPVKALLLDQRLVAGLGNIYTDEALFEAGVDPRREGGSLDQEECRKLVREIKAVLTEAIINKGTTFRDYRGGLGQAGGYQDQLLVYGRGGRPCPRCGELLQKDRVGGRGTVFCRRCQR